MDARVFNIQKYSIYDGPGIRTLVFLQGCPLRCLWCSNPEGKSPRHKIMWRPSLCVHCGICANVCPSGCHVMEGESPAHVFRPENCKACLECPPACPRDALVLCGQSMSVNEIIDIVLEDQVFYKVSGGGMTLGGGEPLAQPEAAMCLLAEARKNGIHTAVETCGHVSAGIVARAAPLVDMFLYDIKHMDPAKHKVLTGCDNSLILRNLAWLLDNGFKVRARMPLINGCNADIGEMRRRIDFLKNWAPRDNFLGVDLLPYHKLGVHKYEQLGESYSLDAPAVIGDDFLLEAESILADAGISVAVVRH